MLVRLPEDRSGEVLLHRVWDRINELKSDVFRLKKAAVKLEMERHEALDDVTVSRDQSHALLDANGELLDAYERMRRLWIRFSLVAVVLFAVLVTILLQQVSL